MSSVELLKIQGIRSFGPDRQDEAIIEFSSPLTLILGQNGCGKTTIIEALKYAVCGELPGGTDMGSGFVHDPKLADMFEVKGNVKLKCRDVRGNVITVSRTVRVQQKSKKLEFKSVDSTYTKGEGTSRQDTVSGKCADIDGTMCEALGTSQAVLTNVIFCHQEDSLWPLEKGKKIKDKFDAIFGITEYNKCLDYFRATSKELDTKKVLYKKDVECNHKFWEEAKEKRKKLESVEGRVAAHRDEINQTVTEMKPIKQQLKEIYLKEANYIQHISDLKDRKNRVKLYGEEIEELKKEIREEFTGCTDDLLKEICNFGVKLGETKQKLEELDYEKTNLLAEETRIQEDIDVKTMQMGKLQGAEDQQRERIDTRNRRLRYLGTKLEVSVISNSQLNDSSSEDALQEIESKIKARHLELKNQQEEQTRFENQIQSKLDGIREKRATLSQDIRMKKKSIDNNNREIEKVQTEINEVDKSGDKLAKLENDLNEVDKELNEAIASLDDDQCKAEIKKANEDVKRLEEKLVAVNEEVRQLQNVNAEKQKLAQLIERQKNLEEELQALQGKHDGSLQHLLTSIPASDAKPKLQHRIDELNEEIRTHENAINELERKLSVLKEKKRNVDEQSKQKRKKMFQDRDNIESVCGDLDIESYYANILDKLQEANSIKGTNIASIHMYKKYVEKLRSEDHVCPLCLRDFDNEADIDELVEDLQRKIKQLPSTVEAVENEVKKYTEEQTKVSRLLPLNDGLKKIKEVELPKLESELKKINEEIENVENQLKSHQDNLVGPQTDRALASKILPDIVLMDQRKKEIQKLKDEIRNLEDKLPSVASGRTLEQANNEQDKLRSDIEGLRERVNTEQKRLSSYSDRVSKLHERKSELTAQQLKIIGGAQKRKTLTEKLEDLNLMQTTLNKEVEQAQAQLQPIHEELEQLTKTLSTMKTKHKLLQEDKQKEINEFEKRVDDIRALQSAIVDYVKKGGSKSLMDTRKVLEEKRQKKYELESLKVHIDKELERLKKLLNTSELQKHDLDANFKMRNKQRKLARLEEDIEEMEGQVKFENLDQLQEERSQKEKKMRDLEQRKSNAEGQVKAMASQLREMERELNKPTYKGAEDEYRKSMVKLAVVGKSVEDLRLYEKAMDWAMIHFHKERMKMINDIIRDLWRHIYRGNDIDYIEIKTDEGTATAGRRTYNYKVIQVKNGIEIDMPGRCSAGQKVLACLIIRMALAETFCKNCGILALDEPTTNLDRDNIESLSEALAAIVERRSAQRHFQLLVITHDEEFLRRLFRVERVDSYLEVKRDGRGRSQVILRKELI